MHPRDPVAEALTIIALDHDSDLVPEAFDARRRRRNAEATREQQAEVLVLGVAVEGHAGRFEYVGRGQSARRHAPSTVLPHKGGLGLGAGEAELARIPRRSPGRLICSPATGSLDVRVFR